MKLIRLLQGLNHFDLDGDQDIEIKGIAYDSRQVQPGYLFVAIRGNSQDGHQYIADAVKNGAISLVAEEFRESFGSISKIRVSNSRETLSKLAIQFYDNPCKDIDLIGVTGTNGKTSTTYILESIFSVGGARPGVIGTINARIQGKSYTTSVTTPESLDLMRLIREMSDSGGTHVILEVSSHALDQGRVDGCPFKVAIFTNFSRDHLDYHETMEDYFRAKTLLFRERQNVKVGVNSFAIINIDDPRGKTLVSLAKGEVVTYGLSKNARIRAESVSVNRNGLNARLITPKGERDIVSTLLGEINIYNILAAVATAISLDVDLDTIIEGVESLNNVPGRLERVKNARDLDIVVDYAHTPDALLKALTTLRPLVEGKLITVFGCGGDRDKGKRSEMGLVAGENSDIVLITSDNPRTEDPEQIVDQIEEGVRKSGMTKMEQLAGSGLNEKFYFREVNRQMAIRKAVFVAGSEDLVLIAGKGHEDYQVVGTEKRHFDDREEAILASMPANGA